MKHERGLPVAALLVADRQVLYPVNQWFLWRTRILETSDKRKADRGVGWIGVSKELGNLVKVKVK